MGAEVRWWESQSRKRDEFAEEKGLLLVDLLADECWPTLNSFCNNDGGEDLRGSVDSFPKRRQLASISSSSCEFLYLILQELSGGIGGMD